MRFTWWNFPSVNRSTHRFRSRASTRSRAGLHGLVSPSSASAPVANRSTAPGGTGASSVTSYVFHTFFLGDCRRCDNAPSSVNSSKPVVSLSSLPTASTEGFRFRHLGGRRPYTFGPSRSSCEHTTPLGLCSTAMRPSGWSGGWSSMRTPPSAVGRTFTSCRATGTPSTVTLASFTHRFASAREQYPRRDNSRSTRSGFAGPPAPPFAFAATARRAGLGTGLGATCQGAPQARISH